MIKKIFVFLTWKIFRKEKIERNVGKCKRGNGLVREDVAETTESTMAREGLGQLNQSSFYWLLSRKEK